MDTVPIDVQADLDRLAVQEQQLQFDTFTADTAWQLGTRLKEAAEAAGKAVAIEIQLAGQPLFFYAMPGTTADNADWIRRKRNVVLRFHRSSYAVGLDLQQRQTSLQERSGLDLRDYAPFGGCFPLILRGTGCVGTLAVSGLPQRDDHNLLVSVLANWFGLPLAGLALA
ncbi:MULTISPECIES: heme-degrading domain-containing protein [Spirosoma]|uniref:heme-degrading domain-containing protein n=1 Tax=Spirosoma TaxID=107 RepID=UPI001478FC1F|nr:MULTISPECIES: heme-degrading domain-containing protein [Spirosoma]